MELQEILERRRRRRRPTEEELKRLPFRRAFVYGRVSKPEQVRESEQSIKEIADLVKLARADGYLSFLPQEEVEGRVQAIQQGKPGALLVWEDGEITVDCRDLGVSGQLPEGKRPGLASLTQKLEAGEIGCLYLTEGMSRLSRDRERVLSYQMLKLLKSQQCRVRTPDGLWNPAIDRDWEYLDEELQDAAQELKVMGRRLQRRRNNKAREGRHVGCAAVPGFIIEVEAQRPDGRYVFGKWKAYPPHAEVVNIILRYFVRLRSAIKTARALHDDGIVFPYFPPELAYMVNRTRLRACPRTPAGYAITPALVTGLAKNPALIGVWQFSDQPPIIDNHDHIVDDDLFWEACEIALKERKPRGKAVRFEPLPFSGLLRCYNHPVPERVVSNTNDGTYACRRQYTLGQGPVCMDICSHALDIPLLETILGQLDFTPYADEVLTRLQADYEKGKAEEAHRRRQEAELEQRIKRLKGYLGSPDPEKEETYWNLIREAQAELDAIRARPPAKAMPASLNVQLVRKLLARLKLDWDHYSPTLRNRLLKIIIDWVEIRPGKKVVEATIVWKVGLRQSLRIYRPLPHGGYEKAWTTDEDEILRSLWSSAPKEDIIKALPRRTWKGITQRAKRLGVRRPRHRSPCDTWYPWKEDEDARLVEMYNRGDALHDIAASLGRSMAAVACRIHTRGLSRPQPSRKKMSVWESLGNNLIGSETSGQEPYQNPTGYRKRGC